MSDSNGGARIVGGQIDLSAAAPGVYAVTEDGQIRFVAPYEGGDYRLSDIFEFFELGELLEEDGAPGIELDRKELRQLKAMADAYSFDHPEEFIELCLEIHRASLLLPGDTVSFYSNF